MKKILLSLMVILVGMSTCIAAGSKSTMPATVEASASYRVSVPQGMYINPDNRRMWIKINDTWVRITNGDNSREYNIAQCEQDYDNNYVLTLTDRDGYRYSIMVYPNKQSLYYNGVKYNKSPY